MKVKVRCYLLCSRWRQRAELWGSRWIFQSLCVLGAKQSTEKNKPIQRNLIYLGDLLFRTDGHSIISISAWEISIPNSAFLKYAKRQASHEGGWRTISTPLSLSLSVTLGPEGSRDICVSLPARAGPWAAWSEAQSCRGRCGGQTPSAHSCSKRAA